MFRIRSKAARRKSGSLSIWEPVELGLDERGHPVRVGLGERNLLAAGEPGAGFVPVGPGTPSHPPPNALIKTTVASKRCPLIWVAVRWLARRAVCA